MPLNTQISPISILAKRNMGVDQEHRFETCVYEDIWTRLTANVSRVYKTYLY